MRLDQEQPPGSLPLERRLYLIALHLLRPLVRYRPPPTPPRHQRSTDPNPDWIIETSTNLLLRGAFRDALKILTPAAASYPDNGSIIARLGDALYQTGDVVAARDAYRRALALDNSLFQAWYGQGMAEYSFEGYAASIRCFRQALALRPRDSDARLHLAAALFQTGQVDPAIDELLAVARNARWRRRALQKLAVFVPGSASRGNQAILDLRRRWAKLQERAEGVNRPRLFRGTSSAKLRIGYVSSFFHHRNWMKPVWGVINHHDRSAFEIHLFADRANPTAESGYQPNSADRIHSITKLSNEDAARRIAKAGIDVLVDLNGYSIADRLGIFMRKPARTIVAWFNMFATTGIRAFDYIIGDAAVIPPPEERFYTERVLRVCGSYLAFLVSYPVPGVAPPPSLRNKYITFGSFAPQYKITPEIVAIWSRILRDAPSARLMLKSICLENAENRAALIAQFAAHGVAPEHLHLEGPDEHYKFLEAYSRIDVALDTFPYNGGTTTAEALWQGVPVLTFNGDRWVARTSRSILLAAGLPEWVSPSAKTYVERAIELAISPESPRWLASMRKEMRAHLLASQACDTEGLCRELERHYLDMAKRKRGQSSRNQPV